MLYAEGANDAECLRILRHEAGHAVCSGFQLQRRKLFRDTFGPYNAPYPDSYRPNPASRDFVHHLHAWYAQAHPAEDFAETFAVWLTPGSRWRARYEGWGARAKLEALDALMQMYVIGQKPKLRKRKPVDDLRTLRITLDEHYAKRKLSLVEERPTVSDKVLRDLFSAAPRHRKQESAPHFIQHRRRLLRERISKWTGVAPYTVNQLLSDVVHRCKALRLRLTLPHDETEDELGVMLTVQTMNFLHSGHVRIAM